MSQEIEDWRVESLHLMREVRDKNDEIFRTPYINYAMRGIILQSLREGGMKESTLKRLWLAGDSDNLEKDSDSALIPLNDLMTKVFYLFKDLPSEEDKGYFLYIFAAILAKRDHYDERFRFSLRQMVQALRK